MSPRIPDREATEEHYGRFDASLDDARALLAESTPKEPR